MSHTQGKLLLQKQLQELQKNPVDGFSAGLVNDDDVYKWEVLIIGPPDTIYEGGFFKALLEFPLEYPQRQNGSVCISILHEPGDDHFGYERPEELADPNSESPANVDAAKEFINNYDEFKKKVAQCVRKSQEE
uniref:UBC core domain-containing protein n=1 Tax=Strongyloides stercoralis TaxID=6248 RepID=A0AAF5DDR8_STRER